MKKTIKTIAYIVLAAAAASCAKAVSVGPNEANVRYFNSWLEIHHKGLEPSGRGIYVLEEQEGNGEEVKAEGFVHADYIITDLEGNISDYTDKETAKQLGKYDTTYYYGPKVITTIESTIQAGLADAIIGMKVGGRKKVIIPSWLMSYKTYATAEDYINNTSTGSNTIYDITIRDFTDSIPGYETEQIKKYMADHPEIFNDRKVQPYKDTAFFYQILSEPVEKPKTFASDTVIYINYTGRLLNGLVFDTTDERLAKNCGIYSSSRSYEPVQINWGEKYTDITMSSSKSSIIQGFAMTLWQMHPMEKGVGIFYSPLGYSYSGSGNSIPAYSPLIFEIEIVEKPKN